mgnify:CR=1 FL=1
MYAITMKRGILLAAFGSGSSQGESTLRRFDAQVRKAFPDVSVRWAFTSMLMRERLASDYSGKAVSVQVSAPERLHKTEAELKKEFASHPVIKSLTETFGASLIRCIPVEHTRS